jgi:hypothetical protein
MGMGSTAVFHNNQDHYPVVANFSYAPFVSVSNGALYFNEMPESLLNISDTPVSNTYMIKSSSGIVVGKKGLSLWEGSGIEDITSSDGSIVVQKGGVSADITIHHGTYNITCNDAAQLKTYLDDLPMRIDDDYYFFIRNEEVEMSTDVELVIDKCARRATGSITIMADNFVFVKNITLSASVPVVIDKVNTYAPVKLSGGETIIKTYEGAIQCPQQVELLNVINMPPSNITVANSVCFHKVRILNGRQTRVHVNLFDITTLGTLASGVKGSIPVYSVQEGVLYLDYMYLLSQGVASQTALYECINWGEIRIKDRYGNFVNYNFNIGSCGRLVSGMGENTTEWFVPRSG